MPEIANDLDCKCEARVLTEREYSNGTRHYMYQCITCGMTGECISKHKVSDLIRAGEKIEPYDDGIRSRYWERRRRLFEGKKENDRDEWWQWYNAYLQSDEWKNKRERVKERENNICQGCRSRLIEVVHHLTYSHAGRELLFQLVGLCSTCHAVVHEEGASHVKQSD